MLLAGLWLRKRLWLFIGSGLGCLGLGFFVASVEDEDVSSDFY